MRTLKCVYDVVMAVSLQGGVVCRTLETYLKFGLARPEIPYFGSCMPLYWRHAFYLKAISIFEYLGLCLEVPRRALKRKGKPGGETAIQ